jgi:glycosyltransferase involved in cell wall biosynthesis
VVASNRLAGTERHVLGLARELRRLDCDAVVASPGSATVVIHEAQANGIPARSWSSCAWSRARVVHVHDGRSALLGWLLARKRNVIFVRTQHFVLSASATRTGWNGAISRSVHRLVNRRVDGWIAVSEAVKELALARGEMRDRPVRVIAAGVNLPPADVVAHARVSRAGQSVPMVASAGRLEDERRFDVLLEAIARVHERGLECQVIIAGSGEAERKLRRLAASLGVENAVWWPGWLPDIGSVLARSHLYVNTWPWEAFGMATAEAMAFALPVVATRSGASTELVEDGVTGRLVEPGDPQALADAISALIQDRRGAASMGERGREKAEKYSMHLSAASTLDFYRHLRTSARGR